MPSHAAWFASAIRAVPCHYVTPISRPSVRLSVRFGVTRNAVRARPRHVSAGQCSRSCLPSTGLCSRRLGGPRVVKAREEALELLAVEARNDRFVARCRKCEARSRYIKLSFCV